MRADLLISAIEVNSSSNYLVLSPFSTLHEASHSDSFCEIPFFEENSYENNIVFLDDIGEF